MDSSAIVVLESDRLLFRHHLPDDLEPYCQIESDAVYRNPQRVHPRAELERSFWEGVLPRKAMGLLATVLKSEGKYIGRCGLYPHRNNAGEIVPREGVLAFYIARPYWGRGLASEAGRAFVQYGLGTLKLKRIVAGASAANVASNRALQNSGLIFTHSGGGEDGGPGWNAYEIRRADGAGT